MRQPGWARGREAARMLLHRALYQAFLTSATFRTFAADRLPPREWPAELLRRLGLNLPTAEQSLWVHGEGLGEFNAAGPLIRRLRDVLPGSRLVLTTSRPWTARWLRDGHPDAHCLPPPWDVPGAARRFLRRLRPRLIILLDFPAGFCPAVLTEARRTGVPVAVVNGRVLPANCPARFRVARRLGLTRFAARWVDRFCVQGRSTAGQL